MEDPIPIERIREAQKAFFPDGGRQAVHEVRHRSTWCRICDRIREDVFLRIGVTLLALLLALLGFALAAPETLRSAVQAFLPIASIEAGPEPESEGSPYHSP